MHSSVLIANRGEIAVRIARTASRLGMRTIAVYSEADAGALHTRVCDEAIAIGPSDPHESYLSIDRVVRAARQSGAACIHPGYGFLSENADFAQACADAGIVFVGPSPEAIRTFGLKDRAKALMAKAGVPVVPGFHGDHQDAAFLKRKAYEIGYPVLIKAVAGGGGKGMRRVDRHADFEMALESAAREGEAAFGDPRVLIEKYINHPRHIEVQIFGDGHGNIIHLGERDCSLQRRHQKVIEEAPAPGLSDAMREVMGKAATEAARSVGYVGAGTVEFIADGSAGFRPDRFWFMEMNTRLQVEHPVTEAVTGLDLVEWQFRVAAGEPLPRSQSEVTRSGHAVEARLYAEDPERDFLPSTGRLVAFDIPAGIRVDSGFTAGDAIGPYYDAMIAKVIAHAETRDEAIERLASALESSIVAGPRTNTSFLAALVRSYGFRSGAFDTGFIEQNLAALVPSWTIDTIAVASAAAHLAAPLPGTTDEEIPPSPWDATDGFQLSGTRSVSLDFDVDDQMLTVRVRYTSGGIVIAIGGETIDADHGAAIIDDGETVYVLRKGRQTRVKRASRDSDVEVAGGGVIRAPMHGKVIAVFVAAHAHVRKGERLAIIEAMKMEHALLAPFDGEIADVAVVSGQQVAEKAVILTMSPVR